MQLKVNGSRRDVPPGWQDESLLFLLREQFGLVGAKFGCGVGQCGACTVLIDGEARRSCVETAADLDGAEITTIEGLSEGGRLHRLQQAWLDESVPQCGYCQAGQIMSAAALLSENPQPDDDAIDDAMSGNLCRCGTYGRIRRAIHRVVEAGA